jgi:hypothetical protein
MIDTFVANLSVRIHIGVIGVCAKMVRRQMRRESVRGKVCAKKITADVHSEFKTLVKLAKTFENLFFSIF